MYRIMPTLHMTLCSVSSGMPHNVLELFGLLSEVSSLRLTNINTAKEEQLSESGEEQSAYRVKNATFELVLLHVEV